MNSSVKLRAFLLCALSIAAASCAGKSAPTDGATTGGNATGGGNTTGGATTATAPANPSNPVAASTNPRAELTRAMRAQLDARSYRARMVSSSSNSTESTLALEFVAPDRFHMTRQSKLPGKGDSTQEIIVVGNDTFMKMGEGAWRKMPMNMGELITQFRDPKVLEQLTKDADIKFLGPDLLDGSPTLVYQYTLTGELGKDIKNTAKTWIGATDSLPRKTESEGDFNFAGTSVHTKTTVTYSDFNADIKIEPPM
jgi:hypothetical protein